MPREYQERDYQRDALIHLVQLWHDLPTRNQAISIGDAIDFVCEGLTGNQRYWTLDPW